MNKYKKYKDVIGRYKCHFCEGLGTGWQPYSNPDRSCPVCDGVGLNISEAENDGSVEFVINLLLGHAK